MIELPLPFTKVKSKFPFNRAIALKRTTNALERMRKKDPELIQSNLDKFAQNTYRTYPRFVPLPANHRFSKDGFANLIPIFSVKQNVKAGIMFDSAAEAETVCFNIKLRQRPERNNSLIGVIHSDRRQSYPIAADGKTCFTNSQYQMN